jgi:hypothetical protein
VAGRALEILGHAIEYLADEFSQECMNRDLRIAPGIHPRIMAIEMLKARNREIYFSCPERLTLGERLMSWLHLQRDSVIRDSVRPGGTLGLDEQPIRQKS